MKKQSPWAAVLMCTLALFLSSGTRAQPVKIVTSIKPLQLMAIAVAGDAAGIESLLDARFSPHDYQFRPSDRERLETADIIFWIGPGFETFLRNPLTTLPPRVRVVALQGSGDITEDGHIWMDPLQAVAIGRQMAAVMGEIYPDRRERWQRNAEQLAASLEREDQDLRRRFAEAAPLRPYLVTHDTYHYFEMRYNLRHAAALADNAEQPSGVRNMLQVQQLVGNGTIGCVFREPQYQPKILQALLKGRPDLNVATVDPMGSDIPLTPEGVLRFYQGLGQSALSCLKP